MSVVSDPRAVLIPAGGAHLAGRLDRPAAHAPRRRPVLLCPPWGWAEVASYRARWEWARRLAAAGHLTLRVDLPSTGNSPGTPRDTGRVPAWIDGVAAAARWLDDEAGGGGVAVIGLGLGGLLAAAAARAGAPITDLALWGAPEGGRQFVREVRASALLSGVPAEEPAPGVGGLAAHGFLLGDETLADLGPLRLHDALDAPRLQRLLLLGPDALPACETSPGTSRTTSVQMTRTSGDGWGAFTDHPERPVLPPAVVDTVAQWLAGSAPDGAAPPDRRGTRSPTSQEPLAGVRETAILLPGGGLGTTGTLAEPTAGADRDAPAAIFLNAGAVRQIGPNRLWTEAARRFARRGVPAVRVDLDGIGDADGGGCDAWRDADFYVPSVARQVLEMLDELEATAVASRFVLIGLCAGAPAALHAAHDPRVSGAVLLNPGAVVYDDAVHTRRELAHLRRLRSPAVWGRAVRGQVDGARVVAAARAVARAPRDTRRRPDDRVQRCLAPLADGHAALTVAFSGAEPLRDELVADGTLARLAALPRAVLGDLPGTDHTLRGREAQTATHALLDEHLERVRG